jgi:hypothetical protein
MRSLLVACVLLFPIIGLPQTFQIATVPEGLEVRIDGQVFTRYVTDPGTGNKPFLWPVVGPTGVEMSRAYPMAERPGEAKDHPHHRSICFGHEDIAGFNTWHERATFAGKKPAEVEKAEAKLGRIQHQAFRGVQAGPEGASFTALSDHVRPDGSRYLREETRYAFRAAPGVRMIDVDMDLIATDGPVKVTDIKDAGLSIRVAHSLAVDSKQGGRIVNAEGLRDAEAWGARSAWVDYSGVVGGGKAGVALFNHPASFRHPTPWHVRTYGLFTANPFGLRTVDRTKKAADGGFTLGKDERIKLRHRFYFHGGELDAATLAAAFQAYASEAK